MGGDIGESNKRNNITETVSIVLKRNLALGACPENYNNDSNYESEQ